MRALRNRISPFCRLSATDPYGYQHVNAAEQRRDPNSLLNWTGCIIRMRKEVSEVGWGDFEVLSTRDPAVLAIRYDWRNNSVLFVHNLDAIRSPQDCEVLKLASW